MSDHRDLGQEGLNGSLVGGLVEVARITRTQTDPDPIRLLIFKLDGVVVPMAPLQATAWKSVCDEALDWATGGAPYKPFDVALDHAQYMEHAVPVEGLRAFMTSRACPLEDGTPGDGPEMRTLHGLAALWRDRLDAELEQDGVEIYPSALELIGFSREQGLAVALMLDSPVQRRIAALAGVDGLFDALVVGGGVAAVAGQVGITPDHCAIIDDTERGVAEARSQGAGLVIGLARSGAAGPLQMALADLVVSDLSELLPGGGPPLAMACLNAITAGLSRRKVALFLDYDGTLAPIVDRPEDAVLPDETRKVLKSLSEVAVLAFVSGRMKREVRGFVGLDNVFYAGSHGFAIEGPNGLDFVQEEGGALMPVIAEAAREIASDLASVAGVLIEDKHFAVAIHYRRVAEDDRPLVEAAVDRAVDRHGDLRKAGGKMVFELRPKIDWHKGKALDYLLRRLGLDDGSVLPIYIGDDVTDEDAFETLRGRGIAICVKEQPAPTAAAFRVRDPEEVCRFLRHLDSAIRTWR